MFRLVRRLPIFRVLAIGQIALLARRHLKALTPEERRRLGELVRRGRSLEPAEKQELRGLVAKLEPRVFAGAAARAFSPFPFGRRF